MRPDYYIPNPHEPDSPFALDIETMGGVTSESGMFFKAICEIPSLERYTYTDLFGNETYQDVPTTEPAEVYFHSGDIGSLVFETIREAIDSANRMRTQEGYYMDYLQKRKQSEQFVKMNLI